VWMIGVGDEFDAVVSRPQSSLVDEKSEFEVFPNISRELRPKFLSVGLSGEVDAYSGFYSRLM
jgi:hypothetical protein